MYGQLDNGNMHIAGTLKGFGRMLHEEALDCVYFWEETPRRCLFDVYSALAGSAMQVEQHGDDDRGTTDIWLPRLAWFAAKCSAISAKRPDECAVASLADMASCADADANLAASLGKPNTSFALAAMAAFARAARDEAQDTLEWQQA